MVTSELMVDLRYRAFTAMNHGGLLRFLFLTLINRKRLYKGIKKKKKDLIDFINIQPLYLNRDSLYLVNS